MGRIDFPTVQTVSLGTGYIVTYTNTHASNLFAYGQIIDYKAVTFTLPVTNLTWNLDLEASSYEV